MHRTRVLMLAGMAISTLVMAGCSTTAPIPTPLPGAQVKMAESAARAAQAQENLVRIQSARTLPAPAPVNENMAGIPEALRRPTTIQWSGPGDEAARRIATIVGYDFRIVGNPPATLPMVSVSMNGLPAVKALEDLGNQVQPFAQIVVDANLKRIEYRYLVVAAGAAPAMAPGMTK